MKLAGIVVVVVMACPSLLTIQAAAAAEAPPPLPALRQVVDRLNDLYRADSSHSRMTMKVVTARYRRELTLEAWTKGKQEALIVVRGPAREAGAATLRSEEGLWTYAPRADQLVRIPSSLLSDNWMGSHFTNDDLMRETDFLKDYNASLAWHEEGGRRLLQVTLVPKPQAPVVWSRVVFQLDPSDDMPLQADYYDRDKIVRTLTYSDPHVVDGRRIPFTMVMVPSDKPGESTRVEYQELKFGVKVDPGLFTQRGLRRVAKQ
jgi:outer membrane lipoprotein-sorting protein